jgi:hypothetical protein
MPPLGYEKYETLSEPSEHRQNETAIADRMGLIMQLNMDTAVGKYLETPKVPYTAAGTAGEISVRAWLLQTYPTRRNGEGEIDLVTQQVEEIEHGGFAQFAMPDLRVRLRSSAPFEPIFVGIEKESLTEAGRLKLAQDVTDTLDLIETAVRTRAQAA